MLAAVLCWTKTFHALVCRSLLTQEGICLTLDPDFHFLEVAYPYVARRLLTDEDPNLRERLTQVNYQQIKRNGYPENVQHAMEALD